MQNKRISRVFCLFVLGNIIINQQSHTYSLTMFCNRVVRFLFFVFQNLVLLIPYLIMHFRQILGSWQSTYQWTGKLLPVVFLSPKDALFVFASQFLQNGKYNGLLLYWYLFGGLDSNKALYQKKVLTFLNNSHKYGKL